MSAHGILLPARCILFLLLPPGRQWCVPQGLRARGALLSSSRKRAAKAVLVIPKQLTHALRVLTAKMVAVDNAAVACALADVRAALAEAAPAKSAREGDTSLVSLNCGTLRPPAMQITPHPAAATAPLSMCHSILRVSRSTSLGIK